MKCKLAFFKYLSNDCTFPEEVPNINQARCLPQLRNFLLLIYTREHLLELNNIDVGFQTKEILRWFQLT
ncbi:hypothetical protein PR048_015563 [Dryococelus australis]|uniref:Uncharacterized protein n=1 Tax=Dryococelus australis TaxID=614101 RepID=A0ABQ9HHA9_9NEOP|nr:hypothetical protein PR048_015563 [Dryococelus australis]